MNQIHYPVLPSCPYCFTFVAHLQILALFTGANKKAVAKIDEAKAKRAEYDEQRVDLEGKAKAAVDATAQLKEYGQTKSTLLQEQQDAAVRIEKIETKLHMVSRRIPPSIRPAL